MKEPDLDAPFSRMPDWDVVVPDVPVALREIFHRCGTPSHVIARSYVVSVFYPWGVVDLLPEIRWRGARIIGAAELVGNARQGPGGVHVASYAHEAVISWFVPILYAGAFKARYEPVVERAAADDPDLLERSIAAVAGHGIARELLELVRSGRTARTAGLAPRLRRAVVRRAVRDDPAGFVRRSVAHLARETGLRLDPPLPMVRVADETALQAACTWIADHARIATGLVLVESNRARVRRVHLGDPGELLCRQARQEAAIPAGRLQLAHLRARGWVVVVLDPGGLAAPAAVYERLDAALRTLAGRAIARVATWDG